MDALARLLAGHPSHVNSIEELIKAGTKDKDFFKLRKLLENYDKLLETDITGKFTPLRDATGKYRDAGTLWQRTGNDIVNYYSADGQYLLKHDKATHELLFIDIESGKVLGYYLDEIVENNTIRRAINNNYDEIIKKLEKLHKGGTITTPSGYTIHSVPGKTTTVLGSYDIILPIIWTTG